MSKERAWSVLALVQVGLLAQYSAPTVVAVALVEIVMTEIKMMAMTKTYDLNMVILSMMRAVIITTMWTRRWSC